MGFGQSSPGPAMVPGSPLGSDAGAAFLDDAAFLFDSDAAAAAAAAAAVSNFDQLWVGDANLKSSETTMDLDLELQPVPLPDLRQFGCRCSGSMFCTCVEMPTF